LPYDVETARYEAASKTAAAHEDELAKWHAVNAEFYKVVFRQRIEELAKDVPPGTEADFDGVHIKVSKHHYDPVYFWLITAKLSGEFSERLPEVWVWEYLAHFYPAHTPVLEPRPYPPHFPAEIIRHVPASR
jgi:hypothetical protein